MINLLISFFLSLISTLLIIRSNNFHKHISSDGDIFGPQKFHKKIVPRVGGISIMIASFALTLLMVNDAQDQKIILSLLVCAVIVFTTGISEDLTKKISVRTRLLWISMASAIFVIYSDVSVTKLDIFFVDPIFTIPLVSVLFSIFAITGLTNAYNIIDGFHGLSSMVGIITLVAIAYLGFTTSDLLIIKLSIILIGSILGFFIWNYPNGLIFLGDSGAYLIGFWISILSVMLTARHEEISPWVPLMINIYPVFETLFTIYRRKLHQGKSPGRPDGIHIHTLIYRRILINQNCDKSIFSANAKTSPYLWLLTIVSVLPSVIWPTSTICQLIGVALFASFYTWLYASIVRFQTPKWLYLNK